jgi:hypothetical protein
MEEKGISPKRQRQMARRQRANSIPELRVVVVVVEPVIERPVIGVKAIALDRARVAVRLRIRRGNAYHHNRERSGGRSRGSR